VRFRPTRRRASPPRLEYSSDPRGETFAFGLDAAFDRRSLTRGTAVFSTGEDAGRHTPKASVHIDVAILPGALSAPHEEGAWRGDWKAIVIGGSRSVGPAFVTGLTPMLDDGQRPPEAKL
jgi:hypothetical protein